MMALFRTALTNLSALTVPGVAHNYDVDGVPDDLKRAQLPALLVLPGELQDDSLFRDRGSGFQAIAFAEGARTITYTVTHLLLVAPVSTRAGARSHLPGLIDLIDEYFAVLGDDLTLSGALLEPMRVTVEPGTFTHGETLYHGCAFRHTWLMEV
ncbi:MAG: hypothetical protein K8L99_09050 [Anaerolineae bacterium]|nr:hypothetical protein [Anaerolineae bacterium]